MSGETKQRIGDLEAEIARLKAAQPTLRDQFAMAALSGLLANTKVAPMILKQSASWPEDRILMSEIAFAHADAMMEARNAKD